MLLGLRLEHTTVLYERSAPYSDTHQYAFLAVLKNSNTSQSRNGEWALGDPVALRALLNRSSILALRFPNRYKIVCGTASLTKAF